MAVELRPLGVSCNLGCEYCYQQPQRDAGNVSRAYDLGAMQAAVERGGGPFTLFGGEPLLLPLADLEALWAWGLDRFGANAVQTNGTLITDAHLDLFRRYRVRVGISLDGPGSLNDIRWAGTLARTREATARTEAAIARLCAEGMPPGIILTLHRGNAEAAQLPALVAWLRTLRDRGVRSVRVHLLEIDDAAVRERWALDDAGNIDALEALLDAEASLLPLALDVFAEMRALLMGADERVSCVWQACDPLTTRAVHGVEGHGQRSTCGRTQKEGVGFVADEHEGHERTLALYHTPQHCGGCQGCRFFAMCKGQCPGTAIDGDWRNRSELCAVWFALFVRLEADLIRRGRSPLSVHPGRRRVEQRLLDEWAKGRTMSIAAAIADLNRQVPS